MFRRVIAGLILGPALLAGSFAWSGFLALRTVFDENRSRDIAEELLTNDEVRGQMAENLGVAVEALVPDDVPLSAEQVDAVALAVLDDPRVSNLILDAFGSTHKAFLGQGDAPESLDLGPVAEAAREQIVAVAPGLAEHLSESPEMVVELPTERIPDSSPVKDFLEAVVPILAGMSVVMVLMAFLTTSDRPAVLKRAAMWAIGTTVVYLLLGLGIPALLRALAPPQAEVLAALLTALLRTTLIPSIALGAVGAGLLISSWVWPSAERPRSTPAPAAAAPMVAPSAAATTVATPAQADASQSLRPPATPAARRPERPPPSLDYKPSAPPVHEFTEYAPPRRKPAPGAQPPPKSPPAPGAQPPPKSPPAQGSTEPPQFRPTLPTRANRPDSVDLPAWTGEAEPDTAPKWLPPRWVDGHGWVLDPGDERPPPENARWVEGVGYVVPGPPPESAQ